MEAIKATIIEGWGSEEALQMGKVSCVLVLTDLIRSLDQTDRQTNNATFPDTLGIFVQKNHKENE